MTDVRLIEIYHHRRLRSSVCPGTYNTRGTTIIIILSYAYPPNRRRRRLIIRLANNDNDIIITRTTRLMMFLFFYVEFNDKILHQQLPLPYIILL